MAGLMEPWGSTSGLPGPGEKQETLSVDRGATVPSRGPFIMTYKSAGY